MSSWRYGTPEEAIANEWITPAHARTFFPDEESFEKAITACGHTEHIFGADGGQRMAAEYKVEYLGGLPLTMSIREHADNGRPSVVADADGDVAASYKAIARKVAVKIALKAKDFSAKFPTISVSKNT